MRLLYVTSQIPYPPDNGVRIVSFNSMRLMHDAGHTLGLLVLDDEDSDSEMRLKEVAKWCEGTCISRMCLARRPRVNVLAGALFAGHPYFVERYRDPEFGNLLRDCVDKFKPDVVHFDLIVMAQYREVIPDNVGTVASINDSYALTLENELAAGNFRGVMRIYRQRQLVETMRYEREKLPHFGAVHTMTEVDAAYLRHLNPRIRTCAIPNGVGESLFRVQAGKPGNAKLVFVARLVGDNLSSLERFIFSVWPAVIARHPYATLRVVGAIGPEAESLVTNARAIGGVSFVGYVSELAAAYADADIAIVPIDKNCGIVNKAIEAMAAGLAVVGYSRTLAPIKGGSAGVHFAGIDTPDEMAGAINDLLSDSTRLAAMQVAARRLAMENYRWETRQLAYEEMYSHAAARARHESK